MNENQRRRQRPCQSPYVAHIETKVERPISSTYVAKFA